MKRITTALCALLIASVAFAQQTVQMPNFDRSTTQQVRQMAAPSAEVSALLDRLQNANSAIAEPAELFTNNERVLLHNYYASIYPSNRNAAAPGDVFALDAGFCSDDFGTFPVGGPYNINVLGTSTTAIFSGDLDGNGDLYAMDNTALTLITVDKATGVETTVGPLTNLVAGHGTRGLAWNEADSTMYLLSGLGDDVTLYTVDLATGTLTEIGTSTTAGSIGIWLAIDNAGNAFMADIGLDTLSSVDLTTGATTTIGPLGIDISFAQDADFDPDTGTLYMAAYIGGGVNQWASVDTTTGAATGLGTVNADCAELGIVAIEGTPMGGGGGACAMALLEVNQDVEDTCMANISQGDLAQSYIAVEDMSAGAGIKFTGGTPDGLDVTLSLWDALPNAGGTMLATKTVTGGVDVWVDVFWDNVIAVTPGDTYFITIEGDLALPCVAGSTNDPYAGGDVYANTGYNQFPGFDYTFRTYSCDDAPGGMLCNEEVLSNGFEAFFCSDPTSVSPDQLLAHDITIADAEDFSVQTITMSLLIDTGATLSGDFTFLGDAAGLPDAGVIIDNQVLAPTSETILFTNGAVDIREFVFDLTPVVLNGQIGGTTTYWISSFFTPSANANAGCAAPESSSAGAMGNAQAVSIDGGVSWAGINGTFETVYNVAGECSEIITNDDCANAIPLACGDSVIGETINDTDSGGNAAPDEFFSFTGTGAAEFVTISLCGGGTDYDSLLRVFEDCTLANEIAVNDDSCGLQSEVSFVSDGTSTYYIMVEGFGSSSGNFSLDVTCNAVAENDECDDAIAMSCGETVIGSTEFATIDSGATDCGVGITSPGVWYTFTDTTGLLTNYTVSLCDGGTAYDSKLTVYSGTDCAALTCVGDNDDSCGLQSEVAFQGDGSTTYYILVHGFGGATGEFSLNLTCEGVPPPNDMIANSIDVDQIGFPYTDPNVAMPFATTEAGTPAGCDNAGVKGVWYNFVPEGNGTATATIITPAGPSSVTFYTAPNETAVETDLVHINSQMNQCVAGVQATINTTAGQAYYVYVANHGGATDIMIDGVNLGADDNTIEGFGFYPNPANETINLTAADTIESIELFSIIGQRVMSQTINATSTELNVSDLSTGTYLMKVIVNGQLGVYKVIKE